MKGLNVTIFIFLFITIFLIALLQPMMIDDYSYFAKVNNTTIWDMVVDYYYYWSGRVFAVVLSGIIMQSHLTYLFSGILAPILFFSIVYLIAYLFLLRKPRFFTSDFFLVMLISFALWFAPHCINECLFWRIGISYGFASVFFLLFFLPYYFYFKNIEQPGYSNYLLFIIGLIGATLNEQYTISLAFLLLTLLILHIRKKAVHSLKHIPLSLWLGAIGFLIGTLILFLAPGNFNRRYGAGWEPQDYQLFNSLLSFILSKGFSNSLLIYLFLFFTVYFINDKRIYRSNEILLFALSVFYGFLIFIIVPAISPRTYWLGYIMAIVMLLKMIKVDNYLSFIKDNHYINMFSIIIFFVLIINMYPVIRNNIRIYSQFIYREQMILKAKKENKNAVKLFPYRSDDNRVSFVCDLSENPDYWSNKCASEYYKVDSISLIKAFKERDNLIPQTKEIFEYYKDKIKK